MSTEIPKRPRGRPRTFDRQHTVEIAMESYWREGLHALGLNELCRRAGISKPGLYREFGGEDGLMLAALDHYRSTVLSRLFEWLQSERPFEEVLHGLLVWYTSDRGLPAGCLFTNVRSAPSRVGASTSDRVAEVLREVRDAYEAWYRRSQQRGEANETVDPALAAYLLDTQLTLVTTLMRAGEEPDRVRAQAKLALASLLAA
ncbi:MAG: TetR/AcrR family transcriptional regulator [Bacteroidota bacterium]